MVMERGISSTASRNEFKSGTSKMLTSNPHLSIWSKKARMSWVSQEMEKRFMPQVVNISSISPAVSGALQFRGAKKSTGIAIRLSGVRWPIS